MESASEKRPLRALEDFPRSGHLDGTATTREGESYL